jgi:type IV pilus assembly protein PilF
MNLGKVIFVIIMMGLLLGGGCAPTEKMRQQATLHSRMGFEHLQSGDSTSALREFQEAEKLNPKDPAVQYGLGWSYNAKGLFPEGLARYRKALELDPKYTEAHNAMGATYLEMGQWDDAIHEFEITLQDLLYPTPYYVLNNLGWAYYKKGDRSKAIEQFKKAVAMKPDFAMSFYNLGLVYKDNNQPAEAIAAFRSAVEQVPDFQDAYFHLGELYLKDRNNKEARKAFEEVVRIAPKSAKAGLAKEYLELLKSKSGK